MRLTAHAAALYANGSISWERFEELTDEALEHGDPDYQPAAGTGLPPWRRRYGGPFCDAVVVDASVAARRRRFLRR